jgi:hypothetical protein
MRGGAEQILPRVKRRRVEASKKCAANHPAIATPLIAQ